MQTPSLDLLRVRRLALDAAMLLAAPRRGDDPMRRAQQVIEHFGYLQLDSVSVVGARAHALTLGARIDGLRAVDVEALLRPGAPLFEYWGHEACWMPLDDYPLWAFRRADFRTHPWWGDIIEAHPHQAAELLDRVRQEGPLRSADFEGSGKGWWNLSLSRKIATALWCSGELAVVERRGFIRAWDLAERVIPAHLHGVSLGRADAIKQLALRALRGHGWATTGLVRDTWRLRGAKQEVELALRELAEAGAVVPCRAKLGGDEVQGWIRPSDLELAERLADARVEPFARLLCPFDPILWDRARVKSLFGFEQVLEIYKPAPTRVYGYYVLPLLMGEALVGRADLRRDPTRGAVEVLKTTFEARPTARLRAALDRALGRIQTLVGPPEA